MPCTWLHKDLSDEVTRLATALRFDPESRVVSLLLDKVDLIDTHRLREIGLATFAYSALALTEGTGLLLKKGVGGVPDAGADDLVPAMGTLRTGAAAELVSTRPAADQLGCALVSGVAA